MYQYLYVNIKNFFIEEEQNFKQKIKTIDFNFINYKLDPILNDCNFLGSIAELKKITIYTTPFEKLKVISKVYSIIEREAKETFIKNNSKKFLLTGDDFPTIWTYLVINADIPNILTEVLILNDFRIQGNFIEGDYELTNFIAAVKNLEDNELSNNFGTNSYSSSVFAPLIVNTTNSGYNYNSENDFSFSEGRSERAMTTVGGKNKIKDKRDMSFASKIVDDDNISVNKESKNNIGSGIKSFRNMFT